MAFADIKCKPTARLHTTPKKTVYECCQACQNYWKECLRFRYLSLTAKFCKLFEKPGIWPWKQHWKKFTIMNLLLILFPPYPKKIYIYTYWVPHPSLQFKLDSLGHTETYSPTRALK